MSHQFLDVDDVTEVMSGGNQIEGVRNKTFKYSRNLVLFAKVTKFNRLNQYYFN